MKNITPNKLVSNLLPLLFLSLSIGAIAQSHYPGQHIDKLKVLDKAPIKVYGFDLSAVKLLSRTNLVVSL